MISLISFATLLFRTYSVFDKLDAVLGGEQHRIIHRMQNYRVDQTVFKRNILQYQTKGLDDLTPSEPFPFRLELKRYKNSVDPKWWDQICETCRSAHNTNDAFPALIWKLDRQPINVRIPIEALVVLGRDDAATHDAYDWRYTATLSWDDWIMVVRELL